MTENLPVPAPEPSGEVLLYQTEDGSTRIEVRLEGETVWLTQRAMAELFQTTKQNVSLHIQHVFEEGELSPEATVKQYLTAQTDEWRKIQCGAAHFGSKQFKKTGALRDVDYKLRTNVNDLPRHLDDRSHTCSWNQLKQS